MLSNVVFLVLVFLSQWLESLLFCAFVLIWVASGALFFIVGGLCCFVSSSGCFFGLFLGVLLVGVFWCLWSVVFFALFLICFLFGS